MTRKTPRKFVGDVARKRVAVGSKSERTAVVLETGEEELVLRRRGGHAYKDDVLEDLVGNRIRCSGIQSGQTLIMTEWEIS